MSDFGADVIKIERPPYGDPYRYLSLVPGMPVSPHYYCWTLEGRQQGSVALVIEHPRPHDARALLIARRGVVQIQRHAALVAALERPTIVVR